MNAGSCDGTKSVIAVVVDRLNLEAGVASIKSHTLEHATFKTKPLADGRFALPTNLQSSGDRGNTLTLDGQIYYLVALEPSVFGRSRPPPLTPSDLVSSLFDSWVTAEPTLSSGLEPPASAYTIYSELLLFPLSAFHGWPPESIASFLPILLSATKTTHAALNGPIPASTTLGSNILRSPSGLVPLIGDFGPTEVPSVPTKVDFDRAYWTSTLQNGLRQIWAPRWTMFSARNHKEKTRILRLDSVKDSGPAAAVDLFVGIGYFAFSYLAAGVQVVLGWDLNPWSIEGARRGAQSNGFSCRADGRLRLWCEDNSLARQRVEGLRASIPPVRHVNCGLLPTSSGAWQTAVECLDKQLGGWIRVHENFGVDEVEAKAELVRENMEQIVGGGNEWAEGTKVEVEQVFRVKSYAPGVLHVVVDVRITPGGP